MEDYLLSIDYEYLLSSIINISHNLEYIRILYRYIYDSKWGIFCEMINGVYFCGRESCLAMERFL